MALRGTGVLANWGDVLPEAEDDFNAWHTREHMPERVAVPGFLRGRRWRALSPGPRYFMLYEAENPQVFVSAHYLKRLNNPTPWTQRILATYVAPSRTVCRVVATRGRGCGGFLTTLQLTASLGQAERLASWLSSPEPLAAIDCQGVTGVSALQGDPQLGQMPTAEKMLRETQGQTDRTVAWAVLIEGLIREAVDVALAQVFPPEKLTAAGAAEWLATTYQLQHALAREDL
jgi:hypothetical protein